jgi:hypothetical protein
MTLSNAAEQIGEGTNVSIDPTTANPVIRRCILLPFPVPTRREDPSVKLAPQLLVVRKRLPLYARDAEQRTSVLCSGDYSTVSYGPTSWKGPSGMSQRKQQRVQWAPVLEAAREIVDEYDTSVTLRQLFYRLVVAKHIPNLYTYYQRLSYHTARGRREGSFPDLADDSSDFYGGGGDTSPADALRSTAESYRRDRTEGHDETRCPHG